MRAFLIRTGSVPALQPLLPGSPKLSMTRHDSFCGASPFAGEKITACTSPRSQVSLHLESGGKKGAASMRGIRRVSSESDVIRSLNEVAGVYGKMNTAGSMSFPAKIPEEELVPESSMECVIGSVRLLGRDGVKKQVQADAWSENGMEELGFFGSGMGNGGDGGGAKATGGNDGDMNKISAYYKELLKSNPNDSLVLRNYGKFLQEVEKDTVNAEKYYGRAILTNPGDGELLSLYGKLIWENDGDKARAQSYFDRAVYASPHDCTVLGSYAHFMWEADEEAEEGGGKYIDNDRAELIAAF